jgi:hypothetical protein
LIGFANDQAVGVQLSKIKSKKQKNPRRVFEILQKHKSHNKQLKRKANTQSKLGHSQHSVKREVNRAAKVVKGLLGLNERRRKIALKRIHRLHASNGNNTAKPAAAQKAEEKK